MELNRVQSITLHNSAPEQSQIAYLMSSLIAQPHRAKEFVEILRREKADHPALTDIADAIERAFEHITKLVTVNRARYDILMEVARDLYENPTIDRYVGVCLFDALESLYYSVSGPTKVDRQFPNWVRE